MFIRFDKALKSVSLALILSTGFIGDSSLYASSSDDEQEDRAPKRSVQDPGLGADDPSSSRPRIEAVPATEQVYGIPTYDALFKYVLDDESIRLSFFHTFLKDVRVTSSKRIDEHMNPFVALQELRKTLPSEATRTAVRDVKRQREELGESLEAFAHQQKALHLIDLVLDNYGSMVKAFPEKKYDGTMDLVCRVEGGELVLVEMQVIPYNYWDQRALAYAGYVYGNQLRKGDHWADIKKVIGINILGGGVSDLRHWPETPDQYMRHYRFQEQLHAEPRFIDGIEIIQYSLANAPGQIDDVEHADWLTFFRKAHRMTPEQVASTIQTEAVKHAFSRALLRDIPASVRQGYDHQKEEEDRYSHSISFAKKEARAEAYAEGREEGEVKERLSKYKSIVALYESGGLQKEGFPVICDGRSFDQVQAYIQEHSVPLEE